MSLNFIKAWRNDKYNKIDLIWRFTLVLIKKIMDKLGDQTGLFHTTNPIFYTSGNRCVRRTGTFGNLWFFHLSRRTTVIQDILFDVSFHWYRTNVNVEACYGCLMGQVKKSEILKHAGTTNKSISTGMKYWVCCIKEPCLISNLSIIYFD